MDLDISMRSSDCPYTVHFYGALFREGDVWICMEVMDTSLDKFYTKVYKNNRVIKEDILGKVWHDLKASTAFRSRHNPWFPFQIAIAVVNALHYLYAALKVIHRDVKPSNILINRRGEVKMCDFGISGYLVDSIAKTIDAGCKRNFQSFTLNLSTYFVTDHHWYCLHFSLHGSRANRSKR